MPLGERHRMTGWQVLEFRRAGIWNASRDVLASATPGLFPAHRPKTLPSTRALPRLSLDFQTPSSQTHAHHIRPAITAPNSGGGGIVPPKPSKPSSLPSPHPPSCYSRPAHRRAGQPPAPRRPITARAGVPHTPLPCEPARGFWKMGMPGAGLCLIARLLATSNGCLL